MKGFLQHVVRGAYRVMVPKNAKNTLRMWLLLDEQDKPPRPVADFTAGPVLVIAPHIDDEVIGCGGTIRRHVLAGAPTTVVYMTDGSKGNTSLYGQGLPPKAVVQAEQEHVVRRKEEARQATTILGVDEIVFLDQPDGQLEPTPELIATLTTLLQKIRPGVIYLPSVLDGHRDHWATNRIFRDVWKHLESMALGVPICRSYECWTPLLPNRLVDISEVFEVKLRALEQFESQNTHTDYVHTTTGLNAYRSMLGLRGRGYAEVFYESTPQEHRALMDRYLQRGRL